MYSKIYNPHTKKFVNSSSKIGSHILKKYIQQGSSNKNLEDCCNTPMRDEIKCKNINDEPYMEDGPWERGTIVPSSDNINKILYENVGDKRKIKKYNPYFFDTWLEDLFYSESNKKYLANQSLLLDNIDGPSLNEQQDKCVMKGWKNFNRYIPVSKNLQKRLPVFGKNGEKWGTLKSRIKDNINSNSGWILDNNRKIFDKNFGKSWYVIDNNIYCKKVNGNLLVFYKNKGGEVQIDTIDVVKQILYLKYNI